MMLVYRHAPAADFSLRQYHNQPPESPLHKRLVEMWAAVEVETGGRVEVEVFHGFNRPQGGANSRAMMASGTLAFSTISGNGLSSQVPAAEVQTTPYAFRTRDQVYRAVDGDLGDYLREELRAKGLYLIPRGCFENGFHQITCSTRPIRTAADMRGLKLRAPGSAMYLESFETLGAVTTSMNINGLHAALESGLVEAQEDPINIVELFKLYEVQKYLSVTDHSWSGYNQVASLKAWQRLPTDVQGVIERNTEKFTRLQRADMAALNGAPGRNQLIQRGMIVNDPDTASFRAGLSPFYARWKQWIGQRASTLLEAHVGRLG